VKLAYSIHEKIWWIQDFLDKQTYKGIHNAIIRERKNINLKDVKSAWSSFLYQNMSPPKRVEVNNYPPFEKLKKELLLNPYCLFNDIEDMTTTIHYLEKGTGINWHDDGRWKYGATYYLNHKWHRQWGGEFMFTDNNGHGWIPPVGNSLVIVKAPIAHKVNPVLSPIMPRISVQLFVK
jgi:Rps23 Pro-64 3,4-dihydroxylase Tpa1-like proline 4-hydroxylase|tara:strand:+ start:465 stop:998 length:534 start_codon:yes stop_codon:yes gene_type:complete